MLSSSRYFNTHKAQRHVFTRGTRRGHHCPRRDPVCMCVHAMAIPVSDRRPCRANLGRGGLGLITDVAWDFGRCPSGKGCEALSSQ